MKLYCKILSLSIVFIIASHCNKEPSESIRKNTSDLDMVSFIRNTTSIVTVGSYGKDNELLAFGSGFIIRSNGVILTCLHVIEDAVFVRVKIAKSLYDIEGIVYVDKEADLVLLKIKGKFPSILKFGNSKKITIGEKIYTVYNPAGNIINQGIVTAISQTSKDVKFFQITAQLIPGGSGGPVFNANGEVVGVAAFITKTKDAINLNFVISVDFSKIIIDTDELFSLDKIREIDNSNSFVNCLIKGYHLSEMGEYEEAVKSCEQSIRLAPDFALPYYNLGVIYNKSGNYEKAVESYKEAIRINTNYHEAYCNLGVVYAELKEHGNAIKSFKQAIRLKSDFSIAHYNLGVANLAIKDYENAIKSFIEAVRINANYNEAHYNLGVAYMKIKNYKKSITSFNEAIRINPNYYDAYCNLGVTYMYIKDYKKAIELFNKAISINKNDYEVYYNLGNSYTQLKDDGNAIEAYKQALRVKPDDTEMHYILGVTYCCVGDYENAVAEYEILRKLDKEMATKLYDLINGK